MGHRGPIVSVRHTPRVSLDQETKETFVVRVRLVGADDASCQRGIRYSKETIAPARAREWLSLGRHATLYRVVDWPEVSLPPLNTGFRPLCSRAFVPGRWRRQIKERPRLATERSTRASPRYYRRGPRGTNGSNTNLKFVNW